MCSCEIMSVFTIGENKRQIDDEVVCIIFVCFENIGHSQIIIIKNLKFIIQATHNLFISLTYFNFIHRCLTFDFLF